MTILGTLRMVPIFLVAVAFLLAGQATAQNADLRLPAPPKACRPCLFYGGDFDANRSDANAVYDEFGPNDDGEVYVPFKIPKRQQWSVSGLLVNLLSTDSVTPAKVHWEIRKAVNAGKGGTRIASGTARAKFGGQFNCGGIAVFCQTIVMKKINVSLTAGKYWMSVVPLCKNQTDCGNARFYVPDAQDNPPLNHFGPLEPLDDSFFSSKSHGIQFEPTWGQSGICGGSGCDRFSTGVLGTK